MENGFTQDKLLGGAVWVKQPVRGYRVSIDSVLLAALIPVFAGAKVLELGIGYGQVSLCLLARQPHLTILGLEKQPEAFALAKDNIALNSCSHALSVQNIDLARFDGQGSFDFVIANPPYRDATTHTASPNPIKAAATILQEPIAVWVSCAASALKPQGEVVFILDARQEPELMATLTLMGLTDVQILPLIPKEGALCERIVVKATRGVVSICRLPPLVLHGTTAKYVDCVEAVLRTPKPLSLWKNA